MVQIAACIAKCIHEICCRLQLTTKSMKQLLTGSQISTSWFGMVRIAPLSRIWMAPYRRCTGMVKCRVHDIWCPFYCSVATLVASYSRENFWKTLELLYSLERTDYAISDGKALRKQQNKTTNQPLPQSLAGYCWPLGLCAKVCATEWEAALQPDMLWLNDSRSCLVSRSVWLHTCGQMGAAGQLVQGGTQHEDVGLVESAEVIIQDLLRDVPASTEVPSSWPLA